MPTEYADRGVLGEYEDAAYRLSDGIRNYIAGCADKMHEPWNKWFAFRLADGQITLGPAETKSELVRHYARHGDEKTFGYICTTPPDLSPRAAANYLRFTRQLYAAGMQIIDPDREIHQVAPDRRGQFDLWTPGTGPSFSPHRIGGMS